MTSPTASAPEALPVAAGEDLGAHRPRARRLQADRELVGAILEGREDAFLCLARRYHASMVRVARCFVSSEVADEVVRAAWRSVLELLPAWQGRLSLACYIAGVVATQAFSRSAMSGTGPVGPSGETERVADTEVAARADTSTPAVPSLGRDEGSSGRREALDEHSAMERAVDALPPMHRLAFMLRDVVGCYPEEASETLGLSEVEYRALLHGARSRVCAAVTPYLAGEVS